MMWQRSRSHILLCSLFVTVLVSAQTVSRTAYRVRSGTVLPSACTSSVLIVDVFVLNAGGASDGYYYCSASNTWTALLTSTSGVPSTRTISTTSPLGGGGDLSANRTFTCTTCATSANNLSYFSATSSAQLAVLLNDETGGGLAVFNNAPTFIAPVLGAATATSLNGNTFTTGTYTLTGTAAKTLTFSNTLTLAGTDSTTMTFPSTSATIARTDAANTFTGHQTIEGVTTTGATGTNLLVFGTSPTIVTPTIASFTNATHNHQNAAGGGALDVAAITSGTLGITRGGTGNTSGTATVNANLTGPITSAGNATSIASQTGTGTKFVVDTNPALVGPTTDTLQTSGNVGIGLAPSVTAGVWLTSGSASNQTDKIQVNNTNNSGTSALAQLVAISDSATGSIVANGTARTISRWGQAVGGYVEVLSTIGSGLAVGTTAGAPVYIGTNSTRSMAIDQTTQAVTFSAAIIPSQTIGITGTTTNNNANAGAFGEYQTGTVAANTTSLSTGTTVNVGTNTNITLTAGDWDCSGVVNFTFGATTSITNLTGGISTTTGTLPAQDSYFDYETSAVIPTGTAVATWVVPTVRLSNSGSTNVFLVSQATFTASTIKVGGTIRCRRMR